MTKELSKAVMTRSRIKNKYNKWPSRENFLALKQIKSKCTNLKKTAKRQCFPKSAEKQPLTNKSFWDSISPFLTNKNVRNDDVITLNEKWRLINDELEVAKTLNSHINIVKTTCGQPPQLQPPTTCGQPPQLQPPTTCGQPPQALGNPKDQANDIALMQ